MKLLHFDLTNENVTLDVYLPDYSSEMPHREKRPGILVIPGGAYRMCSDREAEPVATEFIRAGYAAFVLRYSLNENSAFPRPLNDAEEALELIRANAEEWGLYPDRIAAIGFSAGGHLTASLSTMGRVRPDAQILGYPCILEEMSSVLANPMPGLDDKVDELTPPAFIFHACEDNCVPIRNALRFADALDKNGIPFEVHIFQKGYHGFSTATREVYAREEDYEYNKHCQPWVELCLTWLDKLFNDK